MSETPATPRLSATILLVRDGEAGLEVLMVKRHYEIDFAAGALVFPGGKACEDDARADWAPRLDGAMDPVMVPAAISAVREAFEESGLLLARHESARGPDGPLVDAAVAGALGPHRAAVDRGEESFLDLMAAHGLVLALDRLVHFGHWITPTMMPKRFDTHFFLAATPPGQFAEQDGRETTEAVWLNPQAALDSEAAGEATIIFPTRMNLRKLARAAHVGDALERFAGEAVLTVLPEMGRSPDGRPCLYIPEAAGYGQTMELLENVKV